MTASNNTPTLRILRLSHGDGLPLPSYQTKGAAGFDLQAAIAANDTLILKPNNRALVPTGFVFEIPTGFEAQIRPRSGLALKHGITCLNTPGTIDSDYRGEVKILLINLGEEDVHITRGMRIAQAIIAPIIQIHMIETDHTTSTERGSNGFGSTGYMSET